MNARTQVRPIAGRLRGRLPPVGARIRRLPPSLPVVAGIVLLGSAFSAYYTLRVTGWAVMTDELQVVRLAVSFADTLNPLPRVRGESLAAYSQLYPILTAPAYWLFGMPQAFRAVHLMNSIVMASTGIPAYLLARQVLTWRPAAWIVGALTVVVPWMAMATMVLTEVGAYPVFVWAVLAMYMAVIKPSWKRDLVALLAIAIAFLARTQFVVLAAALPLAIAGHEVGFALFAGGDERRRARLVRHLRRIAREHPPLAVVTAVGALALLLPAGRSRLVSLLGNYSVTASGFLLPPGSGTVAAQLAAIVGVAVGVLPFVLGVGWVLGALVRPSDKRGHAFAVLTATVGLALSLEVTSFLVRFSGTVQDRYIFYLVPLLFVATAACLLDPRVRLAGVAIATAALAWAGTMTDFTAGSGRPYFGSPPAAFAPALTAKTAQIGHTLGLEVLQVRSLLIAVTIMLGIGAVLALRLIPRRPLLVVVGIGLIAFMTAETRAVTSRMVNGGSRGTVAGRDWVDRRLPGGAFAAMLPGAVNQRKDGIPIFLDDWVQKVNWWEVEFWNRSAQREYAFYGPSGTASVPALTPFSTLTSSADSRTGLLVPNLPTPYVVVSASDDSIRLRGRSLVVYSNDLELMKVPLPARADWVTRDLPRDGWTQPGKPFTIRLFNGSGLRGRERRVSLTLDSVPEITVPRRYRISSGSRTTRGSIPANQFKTVSISACMGTRPYTDVGVRLLGSTRIPWLGDRPVGLHVSKIEAGRAGRQCDARAKRPSGDPRSLPR